MLQKLAVAVYNFTSECERNINQTRQHKLVFRFWVTSIHFGLHILSVSVALGIQHAIPMRHIFICRLSGSAVFSHIIS